MRTTAKDMRMFSTRRARVNAYSGVFRPVVAGRFRIQRKLNGGVLTVSDIKRLSERIVLVGERLGNIADAAQGSETKTRRRARWLLLPAVGAGIYALATNGSLTRRAKEARDRASELPDDLMGRLQRSATSGADGRQSTRQRRRRTTGQRRRTTSGTSRK